MLYGSILDPYQAVPFYLQYMLNLPQLLIFRKHNLQHQKTKWLSWYQWIQSTPRKITQILHFLGGGGGWGGGWGVCFLVSLLDHKTQIRKNHFNYLLFFKLLTWTWWICDFFLRGPTVAQLHRFDCTNWQSEINCSITASLAGRKMKWECVWVWPNEMDFWRCVATQRG